MYLEVPFDEKDEVKKLGAKWNSKRKKWFVPKDVNNQIFTKWIPEYETEFSVKAVSPFYLVKSKEPCWKCQEVSEVITFASKAIVEDKEAINGFVMFSFVFTVKQSGHISF